MTTKNIHEASEIVDAAREVTDEQLDEVTGGLSFKPFVPSQDGIKIQTDTFPRRDGTFYAPFDGIRGE